MARSRRSAGVLLYRRGDEGLEVFLVHPGGPFFAGKDEGAWSVPKGEIDAEDSDPIAVATKEFEEETGQALHDCSDPNGRLIRLGSVVQKGGKEVLAWALEGDWPEGAELRSNTFTMEWPPRSGRTRSFPEVDRGAFFGLGEARKKINPAQVELLERLVESLT